MKSQFLNYCLLISFCFSFCTKQQNFKSESKYQLKINESSLQNKNYWKISDYYNNIDGIQLDSTGGPIGVINKLKVYKNKIWVLDFHYAKKIFVYDLNGKFLFSLGNKGKGPGEFLSLDDFDIDYQNNCAVILDWESHKLIKFDLNGKFIDEEILKFMANQIAIYNNYYYFFSTSSNSKYYLLITDNKLKIVSKYFNRKNYPITGGLVTNSFTRYKEKLIINFNYCDTLFLADNNRIIPYVYFNTGNLSFNKQVEALLSNHKIDNHKIMTLQKLKDYTGKSIYAFNSYIEDSSYFSICFRQKGNRYFVNYDKKNQKYEVANWENDILKIYRRPDWYSEELGAITWIEIDDLNRANISCDLNQKKCKISDRLNYMLKNFNKKGNPVLIFFK